jgi:hypothetical protein
MGLRTTTSKLGDVSENDAALVFAVDNVPGNANTPGPPIHTPSTPAPGSPRSSMYTVNA